MLYGCIFLLREAGIVGKLLDPPVEPPSRDPAMAQILSRLSMILEMAALISGRSALVTALKTRIDDMLVSENIEVFDDEPLRDLQAEVLEIPLTWRTRRSLVPSEDYDKVVFGSFFNISNKSLFYLGLEETVFKIAINQQAKYIRSYSYAPYSEKEEISCVIGKHQLLHDFPEFDWQWAKYRNFRKNSDGSISFSARGRMRHSAGGLVFGMLD